MVIGYREGSPRSKMKAKKCAVCLESTDVMFSPKCRVCRGKGSWCWVWTALNAMSRRFNLEV